MDFRDVPIIDAMVGKFSEEGDFAEAMARVVTEVTLGKGSMDLLDITTANKIQGSMLARWNAEVAIKAAAQPVTWTLPELQEAYGSLDDPIAFLGYLALWMQMNDATDLFNQGYIARE